MLRVPDAIWPRLRARFSRRPAQAPNLQAAQPPIVDRSTLHTQPVVRDPSPAVRLRRRADPGLGASGGSGPLLTGGNIGIPLQAAANDAHVLMSSQAGLEYANAKVRREDPTRLAGELSAEQLDDVRRQPAMLGRASRGVHGAVGGRGTGRAARRTWPRAGGWETVPFARCRLRDASSPSKRGRRTRRESHSPGAPSLE